MHDSSVLMTKPTFQWVDGKTQEKEQLLKDTQKMAPKLGKLTDVTGNEWRRRETKKWKRIAMMQYVIDKAGNSKTPDEENAEEQQVGKGKKVTQKKMTAEAEQCTTSDAHEKKQGKKGEKVIKKIKR
ncbi:Hypp6518 [Branchiostoma lanceolatum]|uniref:Hypp6518 protein n=1 Tax=Branchiostoma lanceolatum TaxID=7740 RepID=A0A8K0EAB1_BRALA|nr:Hypp6518 [Branchiostoma lanceolatum]